MRIESSSCNKDRKRIQADNLDFCEMTGNLLCVYSALVFNITVLLFAYHDAYLSLHSMMSGNMIQLSLHFYSVSQDCGA